MRDLFNRKLLTVSVICCLSMASFSGCSRPVGPQRVAVSGEIMIDDEPLESGRIRFTPIDDTKGPTAVATVIAGYYEFDRNNGPVSGKNRIQIESLPDLGFELDDEEAYATAIQKKKGSPAIPKEVIPPEYNERSKLVEIISPEGDPALDFNLETATANRSR